jgi:hypothetical protein
VAVTLEKKLERAFTAWCKFQNIQAVKGPVGLSKGFPDRLVILPNNGGTIYVEFKGTSEYYSLTQMQDWWKQYIKYSNPHRYFLVSTLEELERLKRACKKFMEIGSSLVKYELELIMKK